MVSRSAAKPYVYMTGPLQISAMKKLRRKYDIAVHDTGRLPVSRQKMISGLHNALGLVCYPFDTIDADVIDAAPNLRTISTYSVGFDHIDIDYAKRQNITVGFTPDVLTEATADVALALMLDLLRRVSEGDRIIRANKWRRVYGATDYLGVDVNQKTLGILGMGRIGRAVAKRASAFNMNIIYHNRNRLSVKDENRLHAQYVSFGKLISKSDVISIHVPHNSDTHNMFNAALFAKMKKSAFLINTSRGKVICQSDLVNALENKIIAGAGLDVFESEPVCNSNLLTRMSNVVLAPHIGSSTIETRSVMADLTMQNLDLGLQGKKPIHSVW